MPPLTLVDPAHFPLDRVEMTAEQIYERLPHRYEFQLLHGIHRVDVDGQWILAWHDARPEDWWCRGHLPGRPLLPGVLMLEMAAQASALLWKTAMKTDAFMGFGGVTDCKFREAVVPPARLLILSKAIDLRSRRVSAATQGLIDGRIAFEASVTGLTMR